MTTHSSLLEIKNVTWSEYREILTHVRHQVFVEEQGVSEDLELDELDADENTVHYLAVKNEHAIATARVVANGQIGRMCVLKSYRRSGVGTQLLRFILRDLLAKPFTLIHLHAQQNAIPFYQKFNFVEHGERFDDAGIVHRKMQLDVTQETTFTETFKDTVLRLDKAEHFNHHIQQIIRLARQEVLIMSEQLNPAIFDDTVAEALSYFSRNHRYTSAKILVENTKLLSVHHNAIVHLTQRLPSSIALRKLNETPLGKGHAYVIVDRRKMVYFNDETQLSGFANYQCKAEAQHQQDDFGHLWQYCSKIDPDLIRLDI